MAFLIDEKGNIELIQGDSGTIVLSGFDTSKNYKVYLAIQDKKRQPIGGELCVNSNNSDVVFFELTGEYTDLLQVPKNENYAVYYYGIKICTEEGIEDTLLLGKNSISEINTITVYPKKVEGI